MPFCLYLETVDVKAPAIHAVIRHTIPPPTKALGTNFIITSFLDGASIPNVAMVIPIAGILVNPQMEKVAMVLVLS